MKKGLFQKIKIVNDCDGISLEVKTGRYGWSTVTESLEETQIKVIAELLIKLELDKKLKKEINRQIRKKKNK